MVSAKAGSLTEYTAVKITLNDENDNTPIFPQSQYLADVVEGQNPNTAVTTVSQ